VLPGEPSDAKQTAALLLAELCQNMRPIASIFRK
jgi:hypothetical protein